MLPVLVMSLAIVNYAAYLQSVQRLPNTNSGFTVNTDTIGPGAFALYMHYPFLAFCDVPNGDILPFA
ncbi:MAG: hypothetical protein Aurels2KO_56650 [Aureliella sp.]